VVVLCRKKSSKMMEIWQRIRLKTFPVSSCLQSAHVDVQIVLEKENKSKYFVETDVCVCKASCSVGEGGVLSCYWKRAKCGKRAK